MKNDLDTCDMRDDFESFAKSKKINLVRASRESASEKREIKKGDYMISSTQLLWDAWVKSSEAAQIRSPAIATLRYALEVIQEGDERLEFLEMWYNADFPEIRELWKNVPDDVFIGAEPLFKPSRK